MARRDGSLGPLALCMDADKEYNTWRVGGTKLLGWLAFDVMVEDGKE